MRQGSLLLSCTVIGLFLTSLLAEPVRWRNGEALPDKMTPTAVQQKANLLKMLNAQGGPRERHVVVQLDEAMTPQKKAALAAKGIKLLQPLGANAYFATVDAVSVDASSLVQQKVSGITEIKATWKLHEKLIANRPPPWSVVSHKADGQTPDTISVYVMLHPDVNRAAVRPGLATRHNLRVKSEVETINCLVVESPAEKLTPLADEDMVAWIEPPLPPLGPANDGNRMRTQAEVVQAPPYGLDGSGISVLVYDGGTASASHPDFSGRLYVRDGSGTSDHATHVCGTVGINPGVRV